MQLVQKVGCAHSQVDQPPFLDRALIVSYLEAPDQRPAQICPFR